MIKLNLQLHASGSTGGKKRGGGGGKTAASKRFSKSTKSRSKTYKRSTETPW